MKTKKHKTLFLAAMLLAAFSLWTVAVCVIDVRPIGPQDSLVGFAALNGYFHALTGVHMPLYVLTDLLSLIPLGFAVGFGLLGLLQWIQRRKLFMVDRSILALGGFYVAVIAVFLLFERFAVNYRPVLIDGILEASYPSSTTLLVLCVMSTTAMQLNERIRSRTLRRCVVAAIIIFSVLMVLGRLLSGVHWLTDIIGGILLSGGLTALYAFAAEKN